ncbi:MAG TPA: LptF/LptG family permease [Gemmatimonadaceae bacterium]|jgi:lipopolysaccharide export system permease protein|nr:LptF/LptG family permease [Gemmatimonadaceae bacterium]
MIKFLFRPLDRYVFAEFWKILFVTAMGFPVLITIIDLNEHLDAYLARHVPVRDVALSYVYAVPDSLFMALPAAVLFATVFSIGAFTRHAEVTAAKASGISFHRMIMPILFGSVIACGLDLAVGEAAPVANQRRSHLLLEDKEQLGSTRTNFAFAGEYGRVYKAAQLSTDSGKIRGLQIERKGSGPRYPTYLLTADSAAFTPAKGWKLSHGAMDVVSDTGPNFTVTFAVAHDRHFTERPAEMMSKSPDPHNMRYAEITRFINAMERSGTDASLSRVERALKIAVPVTCIIIALFGAPLATSTQRGGSAYGIALSLATTMIFLLMIQLTRAIGGKGVIPPDYAAWIPGAIFGLIGLVLLARVRT